ncbi:MAG: hypothetical protein JWM57_4193 [Phycisphaerales bacterium]|nr:hypothetical protein [Phycisphaerales bacterium]
MRKLVLRGLLLSFAVTGVLSADTRIVTFGGGSSPQNDQVSLLSNVHYFDRVRALLHVDKAPNEVYFADGGHDKVVQATAIDDPRQNVIDLLGMVLFNTNAVHLRFRQADRTDIAGGSTQANLEKWFDNAAGQLSPKDRLVFYFTGHGGGDHDRKTQPRNTTLYLWGSNDGYTMKQFVKQLDKLDPKVETTLLMVQCYSGGYANVIYKEGDPAKSYSDHARAGFFSTISTRMAAGCTAEIDDEDYHEFSTAFFEALTGETRTGKPVAKADYDHDGKVSYTEAFGYTMLNSPTIDIPFCTSDQLLRDKSRYYKDGDVDNVLPENAPWSKVMAAATPTEKVVLEELSRQLGITGEDRLATAVTKAKALNDKMTADNRSGRTAAEATSRPATRPTTTRQNGFGPLADPLAEARIRLRTAVLTHWPGLGIPLNPDAMKTLDTQLDDITAFLKTQPDYDRFRKVIEQRQTISGIRRSTEVKWVQVQRLLERAKSVILANNLSKVADDAAVQFYRRLTVLENKSLDMAN